MNGNDRYDDYPRRSRRPDPLTDPWPPHQEAEGPRTRASAVDYDGLGYRDEHGTGRRRRADLPPLDDTSWQYPRASRSSADPGPDRPPEAEERPRGRRRRPGPADTGSFSVPLSEAEALRERPRGRRRKPDSEDAPAVSPYYRELAQTAFDEREPSPRRSSRHSAAPDAPARADSADWQEAPRSRRAHRRAAEEWPEEPVRPRQEHRHEEDDDRPAAGRSRRRAPAEEDLDPPRRRRARSAADDSDDDSADDSFALPFDDDDSDEEERPRRSRSSRHGGRRASGRRAAKRKRKKRSKAALVSAVLVLSLFVLSAGAGGYLLLRTYIVPPDYSGEGTGEVSIVIEQGDSGTAIAEKLYAAGVIASVRAFTNEIRFSDANFVPGTYQLRERMSAEAAIALLLDPASRIAVNVTVPEGLRSGQILDLLAEQTNIPLEEFQAAYEDHESLGLPEYATQGPEGYLFPETYKFDSSATAADILRQMVAQYRRVATDINLESRAEEAGYDPNEIMAAAAIVQAESGSVEDMGKVARVIYNRLADGMYLKMDSTCFYALGEYGISLNQEQQERCRSDETGYDTYFHEGLPAGPIVSPGREAIEAALSPEDGPWLYFVTTDPENGVTEFTDNEAEFWDLVNKFNQNQGN